ncbi:MAG: terminase small subunit [Dysgonomonas sp.]|nr:terminase small subunit [Dysgonomonas sp.]
MYKREIKSFHVSPRKGGKECIYTDAEKLLSKAFEYFAWCEDNPLYKKELMKSGDRKGELIDIPVVRPYTLSGMCVYCGISEKTFLNYEKDEEFGDAATHLLDIIKQNQLEGAICGAYNSSFVIRLLNLENRHDLPESEEQSLTINVVNGKAKEELEYLNQSIK